MAYTDSTKVSNYLQRALTTYETDLLTTLLASIKYWIDKKTSSTFDTVTASSRYFEVEPRATSVDIDPCQSITAVSLVDFELDQEQLYTNNTDFTQEPYNDTVKRELVKRSGCWSSGRARIKVTAKFTEYDFTNSIVPEDIQMVATRMAALILTAGKSANTGNVQSESLEGHSITYKTDTNSMDDIADTDPIIKATLEQRRELLIG